MEVEVEMAALHQNGTWDLGIFSLVRRLWVVNEYTQPSLIQWLTWTIETTIGCQRIHLGVDYVATCVAKISFVHAIITLTTNLDWPLF